MSVGGAGSGPGGALAYGGQPVVPAGLGSDGKSGGFAGALGLGTDSGLGKYIFWPERAQGPVGGSSEKIKINKWFHFA